MTLLRIKTIERISFTRKRPWPIRAADSVCPAIKKEHRAGARVDGLVSEEMCSSDQPKRYSNGDTNSSLHIGSVFLGGILAC